MSKWQSILCGFLIWGLAQSINVRAEARWCNITGGPRTLVYPPIAKAARVQGVVILRVTYGPDGDVRAVDPVSGPAMLIDGATKELMRSMLKTDATGVEDCQSLFVIDYELGDENLPPLLPDTYIPGIFRVKIRAAIIVLSDPGITLGRRKRKFLIF